MKNIFAIVMLIFLSQNVSFCQKTNVDSLKIETLEKKIDSLTKSIKENENKRIYKTSKDSIDLANSIVSWTAIILGVLTLLFLIAGFFGVAEISKIRKEREQINKLKNNIQKEFADVQQIKEQIANDIEDLKKQIKIESIAFTKTLYLLNEGSIDFHAGRLKDAEKKFKEILKVNENDYNATCYLARTYFDQNQYDDALSTIKKAVNLRSNPYYAYFIMAENYCSLGEFEKSIEAFKKSIEIEKNHTAYTSMGYTYFRMEDYKKSITAFQKGMELMRYSSPVCGLAKAFLFSGQRKEAIPYFRETILLAKEEIQAGTKYIWPYYSTAYACLVINRDKKCINTLNKALKKNPNTELIKGQLLEYKLLVDKNIAGISEELLSRCIKMLENKK